MSAIWPGVMGPFDFDKPRPSYLRIYLSLWKGPRPIEQPPPAARDPLDHVIRQQFPRRRRLDDPAFAAGAAESELFGGGLAAGNFNGVGPEDLDLIECHDASAPSEVVYYEEFGLCKIGEGGPLIDSGATKLGGRIPVNTSGGLLRKGHPVGATGLAQLTELVEQLRGQSGPRQVEGAKVGMAHNGGGTIGTDAAAMCVTIVSS